MPGIARCRRSHESDLVVGETRPHGGFVVATKPLNTHAKTSSVRNRLDRISSSLQTFLCVLRAQQAFSQALSAGAESACFIGIPYMTHIVIARGLGLRCGARRTRVRCCRKALPCCSLSFSELISADFADAGGRRPVRGRGCSAPLTTNSTLTRSRFCTS